MLSVGTFSIPISLRSLLFIAETFTPGLLLSFHTGLLSAQLCDSELQTQSGQLQGGAAAGSAQSSCTGTSQTRSIPGKNGGASSPPLLLQKHDQAPNKSSAGLQGVNFVALLKPLLTKGDARWSAVRPPISH